MRPTVAPMTAAPAVALGATRDCDKGYEVPCGSADQAVGTAPDTPMTGGACADGRRRNARCEQERRPSPAAYRSTPAPPAGGAPPRARCWPAGSRRHAHSRKSASSVSVAKCKSGVATCVGRGVAPYEASPARRSIQAVANPAPVQRRYRGTGSEPHAGSPPARIRARSVPRRRRSWPRDSWEASSSRRRHSQREAATGPTLRGGGPDPAAASDVCSTSSASRSCSRHLIAAVAT